MSNGVFNSGDLSSAASRRTPALPKSDSGDGVGNAGDQSPSINGPSPSSAPAPLYARFRQSTSPFMASNAEATSATTKTATSPDTSETRPISPGQSFLQLDDSKPDSQAQARNTTDRTASAQSRINGKHEERDGNTKDRQPRAPIPSLTIKNGDDPFYRPDFDYTSANGPKAQYATPQIKDNTTKTDPRITKVDTIPHAVLQDNDKSRSKSASVSVGSRIMSAFRSGSHGKGDNSTQIKSITVHSPSTSPIPATPPATYPAIRQQQYPSEIGRKTSIANIFSSIGSAGSYTTAREVSELGHHEEPQQNTSGDSTRDERAKNRLSDSGLGKSLPASSSLAAAALATADGGGTGTGKDKPANPEEVLKRNGEPTRPFNAVELIAGEPPTNSSKVLDRLIGIPNETPAKAVSTLIGIQIANRPDSGNYGSTTRGIPDARQSVFSIRSDTSTIATTYKEGKDDADESDVDTTTSTLGPLVPGSLPRGGGGGRAYPTIRSAWDRDRERKASAHSTSSDSSAAAVFYPPPPVPAVPTRILASGAMSNNTGGSSNKNPLLRQAITQIKRPTTSDSTTTTTRPNTSESLNTSLRPGVWNGDIAHDAMSSGDEGLRPGTGISVATFETALSHSDKLPFEDVNNNNHNNNNNNQSRQSDVEVRGGRLPASVLVPRHKSIKPAPTSRHEKRLSKASSDTPSTRSQQSAQTNVTTTRDGPRKTLASLYLVAGLPKDPNNWALAENESDVGGMIGGGEASHMENAVPRWFKAEVLGSMISGGGEAALDALEGFQGRNLHGAKHKALKKGRHTHARNGAASATTMTTIDEQPTLSKEETAKIQAKAIKLSMPRDVEIIAAGTAPPATSHTFSFTIKATASGNQLGAGSIKGALGASWDLALAQSARPASTDRDDTTYYGASLIVWTHADKARTDAIRAAIEVGSKARSLAIARAAKAAAAGRKFGERLARHQASGTGAPLTSKSRGNGTGNVTSGGETEFETEVYMESEWEGRGSAPLNASATELPFLKSSTFWLPYALTLVSKYPIYDLLTDTLRLSWARHSLTMRKLLEFPAPRPSERFKIPVDPLADAEGAFVMRFPGKVSLNSITADIDFQIWPVLRCLDVDNLLRIAEIALSPFGRVVFFCQHVHMLNVAVETFRHLLEPRGWKGVVHGVVHTRDIKVYIEDPGPFLIGIDSRCINIAREKIDPEICYVDLETNDVRCPQPPPGSLFRGTQRERLVKKLAEAVGGIGYYGVPPELTDAFPGSRFRPFSQVEVNGRVAPAERLLPPANWNYNQDRFLSTFDAVISIRPNTNVLKRILHLKNSVRKAAELSTNAQHVQQIVRNQSNNFVDKRDLMEAKLWRMNKRLALLMQESQSWNSQFTQFQGFTEKLSSEATDLRTKLEKERREAKRLSGVVQESKQAQEQLSRKLSKAEEAHKEAMHELERIEEFRKELQDQRDIMFNEMASLAAAAEDNDMLDEIATKTELRSDAWSTRSAYTAATSPAMLRTSSRSSMTLLRAPSKTSMRNARASSCGPTSPGLASSNGASRSRKTSAASNATTRTLTELAEEDNEHSQIEELRHDSDALGQDMEEDEYLEVAAMRRMAITETMRSIQERLQTALATAQARARSAALPSPPPGAASPLAGNASGTASPTPRQQEGRSSTDSPEFLVPKPIKIVPTAGNTDVSVKPRVPRKSKSRTVVGHPGGARKVDVPTSASDSEDDARLEK